MASRRRFLVWTTGFSVSLVRAQAETQLRSELSEKSFAVVRIGRDVLRVIPFDASPTDRRYPVQPIDRQVSTSRLLWSWAGNGSAVVYLRGQPREEQSLVIVDKAGKVAWDVERMPLPPLSVPSLSPNRLRVAFITRDALAFRLWHLDASGLLTEIASAAIENNPQSFGFTIGWSPDSARNLVSWNGKLLVCGPQVTTDVLRPRGTNPAWSPDGKSISFEGVDRRLRVAKSEDGWRTRFTSRRKVIGSPSGVWSPDSQYILCNEESTDNKTGPASDVVLYRLADGASIVLWNNRGMNISDSAIISDWRTLVDHLPPV